MAVKEKTPKKREHKESKASGRGSKKTHLTELQKILISKGGMAHSRLRGSGKAVNSPRRRVSAD